MFKIDSKIVITGQSCDFQREEEWCQQNPKHVVDGIVSTRFGNTSSSPPVKGATQNLKHAVDVISSSRFGNISSSSPVKGAIMNAQNGKDAFSKIQDIIGSGARL